MKNHRKFKYLALVLLNAWLLPTAMLHAAMTPPGNALSFSGNTQYVTIADASSLDMTSNYTLECWFKADSLGGLRGLIDKYQTSNAKGWLLRLTDTELDFDELKTSGLSLQTGQWYHVAAVNSGGTRHLYLNGVEKTLTGTGYTVVANTNEVRLGCDYRSRYFAGQMDEVRIWNTARSQAEVQDSMHHVLTGSETGLVAYYQFDQSSGSTLPDLTTNSNSGTLVSSPTWVTSTVPLANAIAGRTNIRGAWIANTNTLASSRMSVVNASVTGTSFAVFGHDNGTDAWQLTDVPGTLNSRLGRVWRAEVGGSASSDIKIDTTGLSDLGDGSTLRLLVDGDGTFASGATTLAGSYSAPYFTVSGQAIANGSYYTLGSNRLYFTVTYNANHPDSGTAPDAQTKTYGINLTLASNTGSLAKTNYTFAGWNTAVDGSGTSYAVAATYSTDAALALYAKWTALPSSSSAVAVYGQLGSFTTGTDNKDGVSMDSLNGPAGVVVDNYGNVYLADSVNNRVLYYPSGSTTATRVYGQSGSFTTIDVNKYGLSANSLNQPQAVALDSSGNLYVADMGNHRVLCYYPPAPPSPGDDSFYWSAKRVYGQDDFTSNSPNKGDAISASSLKSPSGMILDSSGNLYVADVYNNRVLRYPADVTTADRVYGQGGDFATGDANKGGAITADTLKYPMGVALDASGGLYVADLSNNRVLGYPAESATATVVYGQGGVFTTGTSNSGEISADSLSMPFAVLVDGSNNVYVADMNNNRVLYYQAGSTTALRVYGQGCVFTTGTANKGGISANSLKGPAALALDSGGNLYVSDQQNHRVLKYDPTLPQAYTVTYDGNGSNGGTPPVDGNSPYLAGTTVTVISNTFTKSGYNYVGWYAAADGSGTVYGDSFVMGSANTTLYAKWTTLPTYAVTYNANDATSGTAPGTQIKTQGIDLTLATNTGSLAKTGSPFAGWNTAADGTGTNYAPGATYSTDGAIALYAKWRYAVTASAGANGSLDASTPSPQSVSYNGITSFKFNANAGYYVASVSGCGINYTNTDGAVTTYTATSGAVTADGAVTATFATHNFTDIGAALAGVKEGSSAWGDYNNDGVLDVLMTGNPGNGYVSQLYRNNGDNTFTDSGVVLTGVRNSSVEWGDYDNDGFLDILLAGESSGGNITKIYHNNGNGTFTEQTGLSLPGISNGCVAWGDFDNDGFSDIALTGGITFNNPITKLFHNNGNGTFTELTGMTLSQVADSSVAWGDYDNDGDLDLLLIGYVWTARSSLAKIYRNNGDSTFTEQTNISLKKASAGAAAWGDYDNDGFLDIIITGLSGTTVYHNNANGTFAEQTGLSLPQLSYSFVAWGDYDNDGFLDFLLTGMDGSNLLISRIYRNNGNGTFTEQTSYSLPEVQSGTASWADYNNDGRLDILLTGERVNEETHEYESISRIYRSCVINANHAAAVPTARSTVVSDNAVTLGWNRASDPETPQNGLTYNLRVGTAPGKDDVMAGMANTSSGLRRVAAIGNVNMNKSWKLILPLGGTYYWSVQAVDSGLMGGAWSTEGSFYIRTLPSVTTDPVTGITTSTAQCGGNVTSAGDSPVIAKGLVWNTSASPSVTSYLGKTDHGADTGSFADTLTGLTTGQTYYVRAYATSSPSTAYGVQRIFAPPMTPPGNAMQLDGTDDYISIADANDLDLTSNYTLETWFKADSFGSQRGLIGKYQTGSANGFLLRLTGTDLDFDQMTTTGLTLLAGQWYHVAAVNSGGTRHLYVNGVEKTLTGTATVVATNTDEVRLGCDFRSRYFAGQMDEARIWNVVRSQAEIQASMNKELSGSESGLVAYYKFNQISGTVLSDLTGKGHDGTLVNGPAWVTSTIPMDWILTATTGEHGTIAPAGDVTVPSGGTQDFTITAATYYHVADVTKNGVSVGAVADYSWTNITTDGMIHATFAPDLAASGTPHWWLAGHGWTSNFDAAEAADTDGDGKSAAQEYLADTDPTSSTSLFRVTEFVSSPSVAVTFASSANRLYTLYRNPGLAAGDWLPVSGQTDVPGTGSPLTLSDTSSQPLRCFYRVGVRLP